MKTLLIKDIPEELHRKFKVRCAEIGLTQKEAFLQLLEKGATEKILKEKDPEGGSSNK